MGIPILQAARIGAYIFKQKIKGTKRYPLVLMLEPLFRCNLACPGCGKIQYPGDILKKNMSPEDAFKAMEDIIAIGCERILTSGQKPNAMDGADLIAALIKQADDRIIIMPGSGVRSDNIIKLAEKTGAVEFHSSARVFKDSKMDYVNSQMKESMTVVAVDTDEVKKMIESLTSIGNL